MTERFDYIEKRLENTMTKEDGDRLYALIDQLHAKADLDDTERVAMTSQLNRHEEWIERASTKLKVSYNPSAQL